MNLKRTFGTILTSLGIILLLYGGYNFISQTKETPWRAVVVSVILGVIFFGSGIGLVKTTHDEA